MTDKLKEYAEKLYPTDAMIPYFQRKGFAEGFQLGAEFAEWANMNDWYCIKNDGELFWLNEKLEETKTSEELTDLFITDKIKEK